MGSVASDTGPFAIVPEWLLDAQVAVSTGEEGETEFRPISDRAVRLYALLGRYADKDGVCRPFRKTLARRLDCSESTLDRTVNELEAVPSLVVEARFENGTRVANQYTILRLPPSLLVKGGGVTDDERGGVTDDEQNENHLERDISSNEEIGTSAPDGSTEGVGVVWEHYCRVWSTWHGRDCQLRLTDGRRKKVQSRLRTFTADDLVAALDAVALDEWDKRHVNGNDDLVKLFRSDERVEHWLGLVADQNQVVPRPCCGDCKGTGVFEDDRCPWCDGTGTV